VRAFDSLRRPRSLTVLGSDGRRYGFVVKSGEDLRQDQRVQQIFRLMNGAFRGSHRRNTPTPRIETYSVVPLTTEYDVLSLMFSTFSDWWLCNQLNSMMNMLLVKWIFMRFCWMFCYFDIFMFSIFTELVWSNLYLTLNPWGTSCQKMLAAQLTLKSYQRSKNSIHWNWIFIPSSNFHAVVIQNDSTRDCLDQKSSIMPGRFKTLSRLRPPEFSKRYRKKPCPVF